MNFDNTQIAFQHKSTGELRRAHFVFSTMNWPWVVGLGTFFTTLALRLKLPVKGLIRSTLFHQFCGGESILNCQKTIGHLGEFNVQTILDYSVEGQEEEESFDRTLAEALRVADYAKSEEHIPFCVVKLTGLGSRTLMTKVQDGKELTGEENERFEKFKSRVDQIAHRAFKLELKFMIDAEETWIQNVIDGLAYDLMLKYNKDRCVVYNTYQFYRHSALSNMEWAYNNITKSGCYFGAKLVRGAYMETERDRAEELRYPDPIQPNKSATDRDYDLALRFVVDHIDRFSVCAGTHNEKSSALLAELLNEKGIPRNDDRIFFAQLLGMSDNISFKLASEGFNVAKYVPYGPVEKVLPYLFRRAEENTSIAGQSSRELSLVKKELKRRKSSKA